MPRNSQAAAKSHKQKEVEEAFNFSSQGSDDHMLQQALAKRVLAAKDKKNKDTEKKFLAAASKHVARDTIDATNQLQDAYNALNDDYQKFTIAYSTIDDEIRALAEELRDEYKAMAVLAEKRAKINDKSGKSCEMAHIKAIGKVRQACLDTQEVIDDLKPNPSDFIKA